MAVVKSSKPTPRQRKAAKKLVEGKPKRKALREAGAFIVQKPQEIAPTVGDILRK